MTHPKSDPDNTGDGMDNIGGLHIRTNRVEVGEIHNQAGDDGHHPDCADNPEPELLTAVDESAQSGWCPSSPA